MAIWARRPAAADQLRAAAAADFVSTQLKEVVSGAELVVLATPVGAVADLLGAILLDVAEGAIITDLCSVKGAVETAVGTAFEASGRSDVHFVGAHPMAGSDRVGFENARADLFDDAVCAVCAGARSSEPAQQLVTRFWSRLGCRTQSLEPAVHDAFVARISHLPHVAASALVNAVLGGSDDPGILAGPGFRDNTRIAMGAPEMWAEIVAENREEVVAGLEDYIDELGEVLAKLRDMDNEEVCRYLADAQRLRRALGDPTGQE